MTDTSTFGLVAESAEDAGASSSNTPAKNDDYMAFLDAASNPITRAFETTMGQGLAGFITQMDFQWLDQITWETGDHAKAPKACQITISYSPIHDIGPGIGHDGMNRAPIYSAGTAVKKLAGLPWKDSTEDK